MEDTQDSTKSILQQCAQNLLNAVELIDNGAKDNFLASSSPSSTLTAPPTVQEEHRRLFGYKPPTPRDKSGQTRSDKKRIISLRSGKPVAIVIKDTWTHNFVCLSKCVDENTPTCKEKLALAMAGLGEKKIVFRKNGKGCHIHEKLLKTFPKLKDGGGYELL